MTAHVVVTSCEDFGLVKFENMAESRRVSCSLGVGVFLHHRHCMLGHSVSRGEQHTMSKLQCKQKNHIFTFDKARVIGRANDKMTRLLPESWPSTGTLNGATGLHPTYQASQFEQGQQEGKANPSVEYN
ncbi:unnamed protein product [Dibothriocephalus latus]|uniref:Uncharacterized protein n=1 Tax=Dibothriocephalus latus TaxID=60516 RepID=A0A3P7LT94_DIBLA|nr:unnamed protein product [Dibothriocephalus latus]